LLTACCCVAKHVLRLLWRLPDPIAATYRKILLHPAVDRGLSHQMPHAKHEERLKPPSQKFTRAARGWKNDPCKRYILSRFLVPSRGSLGSGFPNDLDAELLDGNTIISHVYQIFSLLTPSLSPRAWSLFQQHCTASRKRSSSHRASASLCRLGPPTLVSHLRLLCW
jgi:hypothetical protein